MSRIVALTASLYDHSWYVGSAPTLAGTAGFRGECCEDDCSDWIYRTIRETWNIENTDFTLSAPEREADNTDVLWSSITTLSDNRIVGWVREKIETECVSSIPADASVLFRDVAAFFGKAA